MSTAGIRKKALVQPGGFFLASPLLSLTQRLDSLRGEAFCSSVLELCLFWATPHVSCLASTSQNGSRLLWYPRQMHIWQMIVVRLLACDASTAFIVYVHDVEVWGIC